MKLIRNIAVAFSLYSQIPMPIFKWKEDDMKHNLVFLPWIGAIISGVYLLIIRLFDLVTFPMIARLAIFSLIPLIITGGFHVDGFMDVQDALKSYKSSEEKLKILKDPNIGAFAIISLLKYCLIWVAALAVILSYDDKRSLYLFSVSFFLVRGVTGILSLTLKHAKKDGMLNMETEKMNRGDLAALIIEILIGCTIMIMIHWLAGILAIVGLVLFTVYYRHMTYKQFGGVTGDTSGYFLVVGEEVVLVLVAISTFI
ncbi:MAG: adenosylcobinamide-GDP ribazoletransferase [Eubacterium sp.]|nr:adenosylcobinamide-GDP ribazoletransferase [Eubacterium sp.]